MCTPENPDGYPVEPEQNMSYNTPDGKPPAASAWGYSSSFFGDGGMCMPNEPSGGAMACFDGVSVDSAIDPHLLSYWRDGNILDFLIQGPSGIQEELKVELGPGESATIDWRSDAVELKMDGMLIERNGSEAFFFDQALLGKTDSKRRVVFGAVYSDGKTETKVVELKMVPEPTGLIGEFRHSFVKKFEVNWTFLKYFKVSEVQYTTELSFQPKKKGGSVNVFGSRRNTKDHLIRVAGVAIESGKILMFDSSKIEFNVGNRETKADGTYRWSVEVKFTGNCPVIKAEGDEWKIEEYLEFETSVVAFSYEKAPGKEAKPVWAQVSLALAVVGKGTILFDELSAEFSVKGKFQVNIVPNWSQIWLDIAPRLGLAAAIGVGVLAAAACVVVAGTMWYIVCDAHAWADRRKEITTISNQYVLGFKAGFTGQQQGGAASESINADNAWSVGVHRGCVERGRFLAEYFENDTGLLYDWNQRNLEDEMAQARSAIWFDLTSKAFREFGKDVSGDSPYNLSEKVRLWRTLIGTGPVYLGEDYVALWNSVKASDPEKPKTTAGDFK